MKKIIIYIVVIFSFINYCKADDTLLLIAATPYRFGERVEEVVKRPVIFTYSSQTKSMDTTLLLNTEFTNICYINVYNKYGYLTMLEELFPNNKHSYFSFINLNQVKFPQKIELEGSSVESNLIIRGDERLYAVEIPTTKKIWGVKESNMILKELMVNDYNNVYVQGSIGAPMNNTEFLLLYNEAANSNSLHIAKGFGQTVGPVFYMQPPKELYNAYPPALKSIRVNDSHCMAILYDYSEPQGNKIGEKYFMVYDKISNEWYKYTFKGNATNTRSYDNGWIAGTIREMDKGRYLDKKTMRSGAEYDFKRESPGYEERAPMFYTRTDGVWGDCFDELIISKGLYYPGLLYLFNVHTKDYIEWDTKQGDSEVLLVQDGFVYYRVNTKILKSAIINNKQLSDPELLIDDARVRDIHWVYLKKEK